VLLFLFDSPVHGRGAMFQYGRNTDCEDMDCCSAAIPCTTTASIEKK
jgi:hypothetical protein